jgi:hypothetical protein
MGWKAGHTWNSKKEERKECEKGKNTRYPGELGLFLVVSGWDHCGTQTKPVQGCVLSELVGLPNIQAALRSCILEPPTS